MKFVKTVPFNLIGFCGIGLMLASAGHVHANVSSAVDIVGTSVGIDSAARNIDTILKTGRLENGLVYFVRSNASPRKEATLKLIVKTGSLQEDDDQRGYAHFVEHMAFNGTASFHKREIVEYLQSIGLKFGADINAYTAFDRTVYELTVPTDKPEYVSKALRILSEWAGNISFDSADVIAERGVIVEEWRGRQNKQADIMARHDSVLNADSRYLDRLPIGTYESIANADPDRLKRYYKEWYRPELMGVVFVGDYDSDLVESEIRKLFSGLKNHPNARKIEKYAIPFFDTTNISVIRDSLINYPSINYLIRFDRAEGTKEKLTRDGLAFSIFTTAINQRLDKLSRSLNAPFRSASVGGRAALDGTPYLSYEVVGRQQSPLNSLETLISEVDRIARFGLDEGEFEKIKNFMSSSVDQMLKNPPRPNSPSLASTYAASFIEGKQMENPDSSYRLRKELISQITQEEIKELSGLWKTKENRFFLMNMPAAYDVSIPETESLLSVLDGIEYIPLTAYVEDPEEEVEQFVGKIPEMGDILEKKVHSDSIQEWKLSNGITVWLRQQPYRSGVTEIYGRSKGGYYSGVNKYGLIPSMTVEQTIGVSGAGSFSAEQLGKMLKSRDIMTLHWSIEPYSETVRAVATNDDLETALQLLHFYLNEPRIDTSFIEKEKERILQSLSEKVMTAEAHFSDTVNLTMVQHHPYVVTRMNITPDSLDPEKSLQVFKDRFGDMSDFQFIITGGFDYPIIDTIVRRYIASLPGGERKEEYPDIRILPPEGLVKKRVYGANSASAMSIMNFSGDLEKTREASWQVTLLTELIRTRLTQVLREDLGGVYSPGVASSFTSVPTPRFSLEISFGSDPKRADELVDATLAALKEMQDSLLPEMYVAGVRTMMLGSLDANKHQWAMRINSMLDYDIPISEMNNYEWIQHITPETVRQVARKLIDLKSYKLFQLFPGEQQK